MPTLCSADEWCALPALQAYRPQRLETGMFNNFFLLVHGFILHFYDCWRDEREMKREERVPIPRDDAVVLSLFLSFSLLLALSTLKTRWTYSHSFLCYFVHSLMVDNLLAQ